jgi:hypothetical protein
MHMRIRHRALTFVLPILLAAAAGAQANFEACGTLVSTAACSPLFEFDAGGGYVVLTNYGSFQVGDRVHVLGSLQSCRTTCLTGACLLGNTIDSCAPCHCTPLCFGTSQTVACPCGNPGGPINGCGNSVDAFGAELSALGGASLSEDEMVIVAWRMPSSVSVLFQGTSSVESAFGDGKLCTGGSLLRIATRTNVNGACKYPILGEPRLALVGQVTTPGSRYYQLWYRDDAVFCTGATFNLSNAIRIDWAL